MPASHRTGYYLPCKSVFHVHPNHGFNKKLKGGNHIKLTRHNGRSGKNGTYNPKHNDRRFKVENSEHIDAERTKQNVYWDCYHGLSYSEKTEPEFSFEEVERLFYMSHYGEHIFNQNERNEKTRHTERNRTVDDLLKNNKTCPEESIYQIGTIDASVPSDVLIRIVTEFFLELQERFGSHIHVLDWAVHLDEGTPHIHERHVFDAENRYGEICPQQEKALEDLGIPLPDETKPKGKNNNRKQTFDAICRTMLFNISKKYGLSLEQEPSYGGRQYLEKQDYILMKQKEQIAEQEQKLEELNVKLEDIETLVDEVSDAAYVKACEVVAEAVQAETTKEHLQIVEDYQKWVESPKSKVPKEIRHDVVSVLNVVKKKLVASTRSVMDKVKARLFERETKETNTKIIKEQARQSVLERLQQPLPRKKHGKNEKETER